MTYLLPLENGVPVEVIELRSMLIASDKEELEELYWSSILQKLVSYHLSTGHIVVHVF